MAQQINLDLLWAEGGGRTDTGDARYVSGWVDEIPTYQNFNFMLNALDNNMLYLAENGAFDWQTEIVYKVGAAVREDGHEWFCITAHSGQQPSLDATNSYWVNGKVLGRHPVTPLTQKHGLYVADINERTIAAWDGNDVTIENANALVAFNTTSGSVGNLVFGNVRGELVVVDVGNSVVPDGRSVEFVDAAVHKIFHEANPPTQSEVEGTIPEAPEDGVLYARQDANWVKASSTDVQTQPPPPVQGAGGGWYNLDDGQLYLDIDDGDSAQWVPANPPVLTDPPPVSINEVFRTGIEGQVNYDIGITAINAEAITIVVDGTPQAVSTYTVVGTVVTFTGDLPVAGAEITFRVIESLAINTPAASTVTRASIQDAVWNQLSSARKNKLINGNFSTWKRGESITLNGVSQYVPDRFKVTSGNGGNKTVSRVSSTATELNAGAPIDYMQIEPLLQTVPDNRVFQYIEGLELAAKIITVSGRLKVDSDLAFSVGLRTYSDATNHSDVSSTVETFTAGAWHDFVFTLTVPDVPNHIIDINASVLVMFDFDDQNVNHALAELQVEVGPEATPFEVRPIGEELALCQRYCCKTEENKDMPALATVGSNANFRTYSWEFPVSMRTIPTVTAAVTGTMSTPYIGKSSVTIRSNVGSGTELDTLQAGAIADAEL